MKKWKCTVCGYIHTGEEPPEKCPVCGADKSKFIEVEPEEQVQPSKPEEKAPKEPKKQTGPVTAKSKASKLFDTATRLMAKHHAHPISVHIPNGLLPVSILFVFIATYFDAPQLDMAAFANMVVVLISMPLVLFSGYNDWKKIYGGNLTKIFLGKMISGGFVLASVATLVIWRISDPAIVTVPSSDRNIYLIICLVALVSSGFAGLLGGKLVFKD